MVKYSEEVYSIIERLIQLLHETNNYEWEEIFKVSLIKGYTGSEILGDIRLALIDFNDTDLPKKLEVQKSVEKSLKYLAKFWGPLPNK